MTTEELHKLCAIASQPLVGNAYGKPVKEHEKICQARIALGQYILRERMRLRLSRSELARRCGFDPRKVASVESGEVLPQKDLLQAITYLQSHKEVKAA